MLEKFHEVCDVCHQRPATHHTICGNTGEWKNLCTTCFENSGSVVEKSSYRSVEERLRNGKCDYCGAPAIEASICSEIPGVLEEEAHFLCKQCRQDLNEFNRRPENAMPGQFNEDDEMSDEEFEQLKEWGRRKDGFLRERVKLRAKNGPG